MYRLNVGNCVYYSTWRVLRVEMHRRRQLCDPRLAVVFKINNRSGVRVCSSSLTSVPVHLHIHQMVILSYTVANWQNGVPVVFVTPIITLSLSPLPLVVGHFCMFQQQYLQQLLLVMIENSSEWDTLLVYILNPPYAAVSERCSLR